MEDKIDLRIQRTYFKLFDALKKLLREKNYSDISVIEICENSHINRATFYTHFKDKDDFMTCYIRENFKKIHKEIFSKSENHTVFLKNFTEALIDYTYEERHFLAKSFVRNDYIGNEDPIKEILAGEIIILFNNIEKEMNFNYRFPPELLAQFYSGGFVSLLKWWVQNDCKMSKNELMNFCRVTFKSAEAYR